MARSFNFCPNDSPGISVSLTGLVGAAGGVGGFYLASSLGYSKGLSGSYTIGLMVFATLCVVAIGGLCLVKPAGARPGER